MTYTGELLHGPGIEQLPGQLANSSKISWLYKLRVARDTFVVGADTLCAGFCPHADLDGRIGPATG